MFHLVNKYGNVHKKVKSERKRDELIAMGYHEVEEPQQSDEEKPKSGKKKKTAEEE